MVMITILITKYIILDINASINDLNVLQFIGAKTLTSVLENKAFVEVAEMGQHKKMETWVLILMIAGFVIVAGIAYYGYTQGWFTGTAGAKK
jgi:hypothetical protein